MKQKSLRQLAKDLGVSHSYLSQVRHGRRPASAKVVSKLVSNGKQKSVDTQVTDRYNTQGGLMLVGIIQDGRGSYPARGAKLNPDIKSRFLKGSSH